RHTRFSRDWSSDVCSSDLQRIERWIVAAVDAGDFMSALDQATAQRLAEETAAAGDEDLHAWLRAAAHCASFSRPILALWRMSTEIGRASCRDRGGILGWGG